MTRGPAKFHWRLLQGGERQGVTRAAQASLRETASPDLPAQIAFCAAAEQSGIDSVLVDLNVAKPDPIALATALAVSTSSLKFIIAARSGLLSPTLFTQQINTLSTLAPGRVSLNIVAGHSPSEQRGYGDFLPHDERYRRTEEFLAICHGLWARNGAVTFEGRYFRTEGARLNTPFVADTATPEIFVAGNSDESRQLAGKWGTCWMRLADAPASVAASIAPVLAQGRAAGLRLSVIAAPTDAEARDQAAALVAGLDGARGDHARERAFVASSDSVSIKATYDLAASEWLTSSLWTGAVRSHGAPTIALVGSSDTVAAGILEFIRAGVSHFIFSGWPKLESMIFFGRHVLPRVRDLEHADAC
jgi:alkanesulfonate monooxygenase